MVAMLQRCRAGCLGAALQRLGPSLSQMMATQDSSSIVSLMKQLADGLTPIIEASDSRSMQG